MKTEIENKQYRYFLVLNALYKVSDDSITNSKILQQLAATVGVKNGNYEDLEQYLMGDKLIDQIGINQYYNMTFKGKKAIEQVYLHPNESTGFFPSIKDIGI